MNKNLITCPNGIPERKKEWYVFLAGPIQGAPDWQFDMPDIKNVIWLSPRRKTYDDFDYEEMNLPIDIETIIAFAIGCEVDWICLDSDGDIETMFPTYKW